MKHKETDIHQMRSKIDLAYERYLLKTDGSVVTLPRFLNALGTTFSAMGTVVFLASPWQATVGGFILVSCGVALIYFSYSLKRKKIQRMGTGA